MKLPSAFFSAALAALLVALTNSCGRNVGSDQAGQGAAPSACVPLEGAPWVPAVGNPAAENASGIQIERTVLVASGPVSGIESEPLPVEFEVPMDADLGTGGSISLIAEVSGYKAYPFLIAVNDGFNELVGLAPSGGEGCRAAGLFCCSGLDCIPNSRWTITPPSIFASRAHWEQHQLSDFGTLSVNSFPNCDWREGEPPCALANARLFPQGKLRAGSPYRVRYALVADDQLEAPGVSAQVKLTVLRKRRAANAVGGLLDLNLVLVGSKNVAASRTEKGRQNLDAMLAQVAEKYSQNGVGIGIGRVRVIEWGCESGGDAYADVELQELPQLFAAGSARLPAEGEERAVNLFMVSTIRSEEEREFTFLGVSGGILGPMINGTPASGLAFSSFNKLDTYNPQCIPGDCPLSRQQRDFVEMGVTIAHEMGHFLGLNHPSEGSGRRHDFVPDTPICMQTENLPVGRFITTRSCYEGSEACRAACPEYDGRALFCPDRPECQFNHLMWWTSKGFVNGQGDGNLLSPNSSAILRFSPFVH